MRRGDARVPGAHPSDDDLLGQAAERDSELARELSRGFLHGMPQAIKDAANALRFPTSYGSPLMNGAVARINGAMVERMKVAGCIVIGKTNMPEFGLGSHTYNALFGATGNAWDPSLSAGGSSGGAAVCLAQRLLPVADGSDFMGSLRNPAAWNHATFAGLPAISVPAGFDAAGRLPAGLQLIGGPHGDAALLRLAAGYEALIASDLLRRPPES